MKNRITSFCVYLATEPVIHVKPVNAAIRQQFEILICARTMELGMICRLYLVCYHLTRALRVYKQTKFPDHYQAQNRVYMNKNEIA